MSSKSLQALKVFLWLIGAFHVIVGIGLNVSPEFPRTMAEYYGASLQWGPEFAYILKPLGAFMFVLGVFAFVAAMKPLAYVPIVYGFALLFILRAAQRLIHQNELAEVFNISASRNFGNMVFFTAMAIGLIVLLRFARRSAAAQG